MCDAGEELGSKGWKKKKEERKRHQEEMKRLGWMKTIEEDEEERQETTKCCGGCYPLIAELPQMEARAELHPCTRDRWKSYDSASGWTRIRTVVDSGASDSCSPHEMAAGIESRVDEDSFTMGPPKEESR